MARQAERSAGTRAAIIAAAADLFGRGGFAETTMNQVAEAAGVAKGAIYHHFATKEALFEVVLEQVSAELAAALGRGAFQQPDALAAISFGMSGYFAACAEGPIGQIVLRDGPAVLGWERWREIDEAHFGALAPAALGAAMESGLIRSQPVEPLARLILGAATEAASACHAAADPAATAADYAAALTALLEGLRIAPRPA